MSYIYLMQSIRDYDVVYKIGFSKNPNTRLTSIQTGNDGQVSIVYTFETKYEKKLEIALHNLYSHAHKNMEWFNLSLDDVIKFPILCNKLENSFDILHKNSLIDFNI